MKKTISALLLIMIFMAAPMPVLFAAGEGTYGDYFSGIGTKFGRGLLNVVTSLGEIPCGIRDDVSDRGGEGVLTGFGKGTLLMLRRILVGVTEVGTFIIPAERTIPPVCSKTTAV